MATMSFKKTVEEIKQQETPSASEIVPVQAQAQPLAVKTDDGSDIQGEFGIRDIKLPRIGIVQKISEDSSVFGAGAIVFNREVKLAAEGQKIGATFIRLRKQYEEKLGIGAEKMPAVYDSAEEVIAKGGSLQYGDPNYYQEIAHVQVVIQRPENASEQDSLLFPYEGPEDKWFAMAMWTVRATAYGPIVPVLYTASKMFLKDGLFGGNWDLWTEKRTNLKGSWHVPAIKFGKQHEGDLRSFMESLKKG